MAKRKTIAVGDIVTTVILRNAYDQHAEDVLGAYITIVLPDLTWGRGSTTAEAVDTN